ncbi:polysaccharide biosynthesis/export family protein [Mucilaginibacter sp.]|uniref:polysaccharide biosynthesis/export family protein n=1 Tax=Mucilaginibacter sp. TaxID=1882438 RepID=UPI0035BC683C
MRKHTTPLFLLSLFAIISLLFLGSCSSSKRLIYFSNVKNDTTTAIPVNRLETLIAKNDILTINISTPDATVTTMLNSQFALSESPANGGVSGYLVDDKGQIKIPLLGIFQAANLTKSQLSADIVKAILAKKVAIDPIVNIRIVNFKITVLGEVTRPGVFTAPNERMTLPEALGLSGDLTTYGKRDNVLLIREVEGKRTYKRFSLNKDQMFNPEIYNLQNQDIIYVEPNSARAALGDRFSQLFPIIFSALSLIIVVYAQFIR